MFYHVGTEPLREVLGRHTYQGFEGIIRSWGACAEFPANKYDVKHQFNERIGATEERVYEAGRKCVNSLVESSKSIVVSPLVFGRHTYQGFEGIIRSWGACAEFPANKYDFQHQFNERIGATDERVYEAGRKCVNS